MTVLSTFTRHLQQYLSGEEVARVESAYRYSEHAHAGQFRSSGEPYISHPLAVASILSDWKFDADGLMAALLHDVIEDTDVAKPEIARRFGATVANLVDGVSKLDQVRMATQEERQAESLRKMFAAMDNDVRVMLIKLADRLHNMRTLDFLSTEKRKRISQETLDIYAAIAARLGLNSLAKELQDLSFKHLHPRRYHVIQKALRNARTERRDWLIPVTQKMHDEIVKQDVQPVISQREKSIYGIYRKMQEKSGTFQDVADTFGVRVLVEHVRDCYVTLGVLHALYKPKLEQFKDYIAIPKNNGYQSLHTTLVMPNGTTVEIQIRTQDMHRRAEVGLAAHWLYKENEKAASDATASDAKEAAHDLAQADATRSLSSLLEIQKLAGDSREFLDSIKRDLFPDEIYVFTPRGKLIALPRGATPLDFAYAVHTQIGDHAVAGVVNGDQQPLYHPLHNGDRVEVITDTHAHPTPAWVGFAHTARAKSRIRHYLRTMQETESAHLGERLLRQAVLTLSGSWESLSDQQWIDAAHVFEAKSRRELCALVGSGRALAFSAAAQLLQLKWESVQTHEDKATIVLTSAHHPGVRFAKCCQPIPGDSITGIFRKSVGLEVHQASCVQTKNRSVLIDAVEWVDVSWAEKIEGAFVTSARVFTEDRKGVLAQLSATIAQADADIDAVHIEHSTKTARQAAITFVLRVPNTAALARVIRDLRILPEVRRALRVKPVRTSDPT